MASERVATGSDTAEVAAASAANNTADSVTSGSLRVQEQTPADTTPSATAGTVAETPQAPAPMAQEPATGAGVAAPGTEAVASDSQISADVKSEIATTAPNSNVDVQTTNGVVALAGTVPSQDVVEQARQAAQRVAGVKAVDASALTISNQ